MQQEYKQLVSALEEAAKHAVTERVTRLVNEGIDIDYSELASEIDGSDVAEYIELSDLSDNIDLSDLVDHIEIDDRIYSAVNDCLADHVSSWFNNNTNELQCAMREAIAWHHETRATPWRRFVSACKRRWYAFKARFRRSKEA